MKDLEPSLGWECECKRLRTLCKEKGDRIAALERERDEARKDINEGITLLGYMSERDHLKEQIARLEEALRQGCALAFTHQVGCPIQDYLAKNPAPAPAKGEEKP